MKSIRILLLIMLPLMWTSCSKVHPASDDLEGEALLQIGLSVDSGVEIVTRAEESGEEEDSPFPTADEMYVELYRLGINQNKPNATVETWNRIYFGLYSEAKEKVFRVNGGNWKMLAFYGDSTACGFNKPFVYAYEEFVVDGGLDENGNPNTTTVDAVAKVSNVRIKVNFDETVSGSYYDYFVRFSNIDTLESRDPIRYKQILRYKKGETRDAYMMPTQKLKIEFMAQHEYGQADSWKYTTLVEEMVVEGNDFLQVNLKVTNPREGKLDVNITTDDNIVREDSNVEIDEVWAPQDAPKVVPAGFVDGDHAVVEGDNSGNSAVVSVLARAGLKNFFLTVSSDYLTGAGIDVPLDIPIDLANPSEAPSGAIEKLKAAGFEWDDNMLGTRTLTYLKMTKLFEKINSLNPSLPHVRALAEFKIEVVDSVEHSTSETLTATAYPITQELTIPIGNVWSNKIISPLVSIGKGVGSLFRLQVSRDGQNWSDLKGFERIDNSVIDYGTLEVDPATTYHYRSIYNNNPNLVSNVVTVTTEAQLQVGNPGFEDYHTAIMRVDRMTGADYDREWYLPYKSGESDTWWAVNSKKSMPNNHAQYFDYNWCKNFPCTAFSTYAHSGVKSAMVYSVNVGFGNTDNTAVGTTYSGEIWIGKADNSGNHTQDGHQFASRPSAVKFWYTYQPIAGESFVAVISIRDSENNEIARAEKSSGETVAEWALCELPIVYTNIEKKAAYIYISFKPCNSGGVKTKHQMEIAGIQQIAHIGSVLKIDDIELIY